jgi:hypothetical protein
MSEKGFSRRHFFYGALLTGAVPAGGFGSTPSLAQAGYKSPNEKLNLAAIGAGNQGFLTIQATDGGRENVVALVDVDFARGTQGFATYPKAEKYRDYRSMLDAQSKDIDAVTIGIPDHMHAHAALACMQLGKHVYVQKPLTRTAWEARFLTQAALKYPKVATQMGNQGISSEAARVGCEILWSGEIGDVTEVHAWNSRPSWPQGMTKIPPPTPVPDTLNWDLWLGTAAFRPFTDGDQEYFDFVAARSARNRPGGMPGAPGGPGAPGASIGMPGGPGGAPGGQAAAGRGGAGGRGGNSIPTGTAGASVQTTGAYAGGFYLPFNWRGFYDFGTSLIGDWGVHILGVAHWGLMLDPKYLISVECVLKDGTPPFTYPDEVKIKYEFGPRPGMGPVTVYWYQHGGGDAYIPEGMTAEEARAIPGTGPTIASGRGGAPAPAAPAAGARGAAPAAAGAPGAGAAPGGAAPGGGRGGPQGSGYNCIFKGTKGYMGTSGQTGGVGLLPGKRWADYRLPAPLLQRSPGANHYRDWVRACKGGPAACANFAWAGPYTEWLVLGAAAVHTEGKLMWDNAKGEFSNGKHIQQWVKPTYRKGWEIKL